MNISHIPAQPGVYLFKDGRGKILYIGKAKNLSKRVSQYFAPGSVWKQDMLRKAKRVDFLEVTTESEALYLEDNLIKQHNPEYNRLLKGDNSYIYLKIGKGNFPEIYLTRMRKNDGATYVGPKNNTKHLKKLMHYLRQIYKYRVMKPGEFKLGKASSDFYFGLDGGRSIIEKHKDNILARNLAVQGLEKSFDKTYDEYKKEYKKIIKDIISFFEGNTKKVKKKIHEDMKIAIEKEHFERCAVLRDILQQVDLWSEKQHVVLEPIYTGKIVRITDIQNYRVIILVKVFEGKMIDVIRQKKKKSERSLNQIQASLQADFGDMDNYNEYNHTILISQSMKKIKKKARGEITILLNKFLESYIASTTFDSEENLTQELLQQLQSRYKLSRLPYHIECIDISHLSGSHISGGLSCMKEGLLHKYGYRNYKIKLLENNKSNYSNDFLSLQEVIVRRFNLQGKKGGKQEFPDLFIIDGGKGQLSILRELVSLFPELSNIMKTTEFVSLGKGKARQESGKSSGEGEIIYSFGNTNEKLGEIQETPLLYDIADRLLTKIRDESHRFANRYRKKRMSKQWE